MKLIRFEWLFHAGAVLLVFMAIEAWFFEPSQVELPRSVSGTSQVQLALETLWHSPSGYPLIERAMKLYGVRNLVELSKKIKTGAVSKTDAVLSRSLDSETGKEVKKRQTRISLRLDQPFSGVVLDLAHEMVHATSDASWDPYDPALTARRFIEASIEGRGGEADALSKECQVAKELYGFDLEGNRRCKDYWSVSEKDRRSLIISHFYRVGRWYGALKSQMKRFGVKLSKVSADKALLFSSTGGVPYPLGLMLEYYEMNRLACANTIKRLKLFQWGASRSTPSKEKRFVAYRCSDLQPTL